MKIEKTPLYLAFWAFVGQIFEVFFIILTRTTFVFLTYNVCKSRTLRELLTKFVRKEYLYGGNYNQSLKDIFELISLDVWREVLKLLNLVGRSDSLFLSRGFKAFISQCIQFCHFSVIVFLTKISTISCQDN